MVLHNKIEHGSGAWVAFYVDPTRTDTDSDPADTRSKLGVRVTGMLLLWADESGNAWR
jgi:hypothetical protein